MKYYIAAPGRKASGGPELLHQLCYELRKLGYDARMLYYYIDDVEGGGGGDEYGGNPVHPNYERYGNAYTLDGDSADSRDVCLIAPEPVCLMLFSQMEKCKKIIWWLSVDFFYEYNTVRDSMSLKTMDITHMVQSRYAENILRHIFGVPGEKIRYLSDYLRPEFLEEAKGEEEEQKKNIVAYNPKKGMKYTQYIMERARERGKPLQFVPLCHMTPGEVAGTLRQAKAYIDFGSHPGKDRIPREAAISGCCVITGREGSAAYPEDVPIPEAYKFKDPVGQADEIIDMLEDICANYQFRRADFEEYRCAIAYEKASFEADVRRIFDEIERGSF